MIDATNPWIDMARMAIAPTLADNDRAVRGHEKIDDDAEEGPLPKVARARPRLGEQVSPITLAVRRHRARQKALADL